MGQIIELLKSINYQVSKELLFNYKNMNISDRQMIIIIYLINQASNIYNPKQISNDLKSFESCVSFLVIIFAHSHIIIIFSGPSLV